MIISAMVVPHSCCQLRSFEKSPNETVEGQDQGYENESLQPMRSALFIQDLLLELHPWLVAPEFDITEVFKLEQPEICHEWSLEGS